MVACITPNKNILIANIELAGCSSRERSRFLGVYGLYIFYKWWFNVGYIPVIHEFAVKMEAVRCREVTEALCK